MCWATPSISDAVGASGWRWRICILIKFPGEADSSAAGARVENCYPGKGEAQCSHCRGEETEPQDAEVLTRSYSSDRIQTQIFLDSGAPAISTIP